METFNHPLRLFQFCPKCGSGHFIENNKQSKRCEACGFVLYFNPKGAVVGIITNEKGDILEYNVYQAVLIVRYSSDEKLYLYDIQNIKKETRYPSWTRSSDGQKPVSFH